MSAMRNEEFKSCTAKTKSALVLDIIQGKTMLAEANRGCDLPPSEIEHWGEEGKRGRENALRANSQDIKQQYDKPLREHQEPYGEAMLGLRTRNNCSRCWEGIRNDRDRPTGN